MIHQTRAALIPRNAQDAQDNLLNIQQANYKPPKLDEVDDEIIETEAEKTDEPDVLIVDVGETGLLEVDETKDK